VGSGRPYTGPNRFSPLADLDNVKTGSGETTEVGADDKSRVDNDETPLALCLHGGESVRGYKR
jgi:hypothetical protein